MKRKIIILTIFSLLALHFSFADNPELPKYFNFSDAASLRLWQAKFFRGKTVYCIGKENAVCFLDAKSSNSASALYYKFNRKFSIKDYPMISWRWRVLKFPDTQRPTAYPLGEDLPLRIYVIFPSWNILSTRVIEYVWDEHIPEETISTSTTFSGIKLIVVQSGKMQNQDWVAEERNVYEDYKKAFGNYPRLKAGAVAIMSDSETYGDSSHAQLLDLKVGYNLNPQAGIGGKGIAQRLLEKISNYINNIYTKIRAFINI